MQRRRFGVDRGALVTEGFLQSCIKMAACSASRVTLSVTVNLKGSKGMRQTVVDNAIRQFSPNDTWFDVYDVVTEDVSDKIPEKVDETFENVPT